MAQGIRQEQSLALSLCTFLTTLRKIFTSFNVIAMQSFDLDRNRDINLAK